ncbi:MULTISPECIES: DUF624 domain-containing protein [Clostridia]|uniref:YesL family protein n=1 Tax=Clostridia TaxID=186801 RepID=UPI000EA15682|nr:MULTISPECIES: DUF624 domain-containing protein [Clostridia]NBJ68847.1 DUF624 domain-containing protein [Roseburia sp. 1XD42-34]RKI80225.1 DUF624 domain-containing protein [Clostridium sp. 1xD42-85]
MQGVANGFFRVSEWVMRLAYLNLLWIAFTFLGLAIFGFMPATTAMFAIVRKWQRGVEDFPIFTTFWSVYKKDFKSVNIIGVVLFLLGYFLSIEFQILKSQTELIYYLARFGVMAQFILYSIVVAYFFPIFVHFKLTKKDYFKWTFIIGLSHPILTVFLLGLLTFFYFIIIKTIPAFLFFFGGSATAFILMWGVSLTFSKLEENKV